MVVVEETDPRFYVAESKLPGAGMGVFTKVKINKGDFLEIIGVCVKFGGMADKCTHYANAYKFAAEPDGQFVHSLVPMGLGGMVNQANDRSQQNVAIMHLPEKIRCDTCNGTCKVDNGSFIAVCGKCEGKGVMPRPKRNPHAIRVAYVAVRDIEPGEEVLGNYNKKLGQMAADGTSWTTEDQEEWDKFLNRKLYGLEVILG